jgi:hypothetical protein
MTPIERFGHVDPASEALAGAVSSGFDPNGERSRILANTIDGTLQALGLNPPEDREALSALRHLLERYPSDHGRWGVRCRLPPAGGCAGSRRPARGRSPAKPPGGAGRPRLASVPGGVRRLDRPGRLPVGQAASLRVRPPARAAVQRPAGRRGVPTAASGPSRDPYGRRIRDGRCCGPRCSCLLARWVHVRRRTARRAVDEVGSSFPRSQWVSALPGGPSGVVGDPAYVNLLLDWLMNEAYPQSCDGATCFPRLSRSKGSSHHDQDDSAPQRVPCGRRSS